MTALVIVVHVIASLTLVLFILLHAGRGGGLSDMFGGGMGTSLGGSTVVERNLDRLTVGAATIFGITSVLLALVTPGSLDPAQATSAEWRLLVGNLFDSLTTLDPAGTVRPAAAASWSSDQTMRHWRFQLRAGATYADGRAVRAGDFRAAWERLAS